MGEIMKTHFVHDRYILNGFFALQPDEWHWSRAILSEMTDSSDRQEKPSSVFSSSPREQLVKKALQKLTLF